MYDLKVVVEEVRGFCDLPMQPGDYFEVQGGKIIIPPGKYVCLWALQSMMPLLPLKQRRSSEANDWVPYTKRICCPDPNGMVIYRIDIVGDAASDQEEVRPRLLVAEDKCTGCRACELACSLANYGEFAPEKAYIRIDKDEPEGLDQPRVCRQCGNAPCMSVCPAGALSKEPTTKALLVDAAKCTGCLACSRACPFAAVFARPDGKAGICHLCQGRPGCVERCPTGAISFGRKGGVR
jgi:uncharacterized repeat protein (TIGR04076 family)